MEGTDETFDAVFFIGYHAHGGNEDGVMNHTITGTAVTGIRRNGILVGETAINAGIAGAYGVPGIDQWESLCGTRRRGRLLSHR